MDSPVNLLNLNQVFLLLMPKDYTNYLFLAVHICISILLLICWPLVVDHFLLGNQINAVALVQINSELFAEFQLRDEIAPRLLI